MSDEIVEIPPLSSRRPLSNEEWGVFVEKQKLANEEHIGLREFLEQMKGGTLRTCYYLERIESKNGFQVLTEDSKGEAVIAIHDEKLFGPVKRGDLVMIAGDPISGFAIVGRCPIQPGIGAVVTFERVINKNKIEVGVGEGRKEVYWASQELADQIGGGGVKPGAQLVCAPGPRIAFEAVPPPDEMNRFQFLLNEDAPDVQIDRDIGAPPACLFEVLEFFRMEMVNPKLRRKYGTRPLHTRLFTGPPGGGKTLVLKAIHRAIYDIIREVVGVDEKAAGHRVLKMKSSQMLSMWLGESEKNFDRFFDEVVEIARRPVKVGKKERRVLPTFVILEEFDALARQREGHAHDPIERIMTTLLQRLDPINEELSSGIICLIATTNEPGLIDRAALRRIGGKIDYFGMLTASSFPKVLEKHISRLPMASSNGDKQHELRSRAVEELTNLFFTEDNKHIAEIELKGQPGVNKYRRDFFSGALVDRAVQEAAGVALKAEFEGNGDGIDSKQLAVAFNNQVGSIIQQLDERNAHKYVDIPDGGQVSKVRKV